MLKINLLPSAARQSAAAPSEGNNKIFAIALVGGLTVLCSGLFIYHSSLQGDLDKLKGDNRNVQNQVNTIRARVADRPQILAELESIRAREAAINSLEAARTGPMSMLIELSHILSPGGRPSSDPRVLERVQRDNPTQMYNTTWDPHRLWITKFTERNRAVTIEGSGRTADDVGEFMRRMMLSQYFEEVRLERSEGTEDEQTHISVQKFKITCRVRY